MENQRFEDSFREAFNGAEIIPSDSVWTNITVALDKNSGKKGLLLLIQLLAAASLLYAMGITGTYYLHKPQVENSQPIAQNTYKKPLQRKREIPAAEIIISDLNSISKDKANLKTTLTEFTPEQALPVSVITDKLREVEAPEINKEFQLDLPTAPQLADVQQPNRVLPVSTAPDPGIVLLARLKDEERKYQPKKKRSTEKLWTSIGVGVGSFNPSSSTSIANASSMRTLSSSSTTSSASSSVGTSYTIGINVATKVTERIVLQGGVSYLGQNAEFTSSTAIVDKRAILSDHTDGVEEMTTTSLYKVRSASQYMSIPLQAGYIIVDQDFAVQFNGGISTDVFIQNTLTPENEQERVTHRSGNDSPYRTINFSGLLGTELSYKVGDHYRITVNPGLRYALNSIYKTEGTTEISPVTFDVALRFRYIFK